MKFRWEKQYLYWGITAFLVIVCSISFFLILDRIETVQKVLHTVLQILTPFSIGLVLAYLVSPVMDFFEVKVFRPLLTPRWKKMPKPLPRILALVISIVLVLAIIAGLLVMVVPQLIDSIKGIVNNLQYYFTNLENWIMELAASDPELTAMLESLFNDLNQTITEWASKNFLPQLEQIISGLTTGVVGFFKFLTNTFVGLVIAIYVLFDKEHFFAQSKKLTYAIFPVQAANTLLRTVRRADAVFGSFIKGKLIDSLLIGLLCFVGMSIFKLPFALLISVMVGVTNIIPFFGPFIGAIPSAILILMVDPLKCLYFVLFVLALQQFDGNILGPKILGDSTGLSAFWVMFAILTFGGALGFAGMVIGVPTFALIYELISDFASSRLKKHELPVSTDEYRDIDYINTIEHEAVMKEEVDDVKIADFPSKKK